MGFGMDGWQESGRKVEVLHQKPHFLFFCITHLHEDITRLDECITHLDDHLQSLSDSLLTAHDVRVIIHEKTRLRLTQYNLPFSCNHFSFLHFLFPLIVVSLVSCVVCFLILTLGWVFHYHRTFHSCEI